MRAVDVSTWVAGWFSLAAVVAYGIVIIGLALRAKKSRDSYQFRVLVTGTRGKSGTVRLIHAGLVNSGVAAYGKVTGTIAVELMPNGTEHSTRRLGTAGITEMTEVVHRGAKAKATHGIFECMAISPKLIHTIQAKYVHAHVVVIPSIRLDHLEDEGLTEFEIGMNILNAIDRCQYLVTGIEQPELLRAYREWCEARGTVFIHCVPDANTPFIPGHHPVNIAISQAVVGLAGVNRGLVDASLKKAGLEPRALDLFELDLAKVETLLVDIGSANDPESAYEALQVWKLDQEAVVPVLVNRWERPLRSVVFSAALVGRYPVALVTGPLFHWLRRRNAQKLLGNGNHGVRFSTKFVQVTYLDCFFPDRLIKKIEKAEPNLVKDRLVLLLVENAHGTKVDILRSRFEKGRKLTQKERFSV